MRVPASAFSRGSDDRAPDSNLEEIFCREVPILFFPGVIVRPGCASWLIHLITETDHAVFLESRLTFLN
jgi:hypothetical protein